MKLSRPRIDSRTGKLFLRPTIHLPNGRTLRPYVSAGAWGLPDTAKGVAEAAEREIARAYAEHAAASGALSTVNPNPNPIPTATPVVAAPTITVKEIPTLSAYLPIWFAHGQVKGNKRQTQHAHTTFVNAVGARLGDLRLDEINASVFRGWQREMFKAELAPGTINGRLMLLAAVLRLATSDGLISGVPAYEEVKSDRAEVKYFTPEQVIALIDGAFACGRWLIARLIDAASRTGLRIGELRALRRTDVDLVAGEITIRGSVARGKIDSTKTRDVRVLPLSPDAVPLFETLFAELDAQGFTSPFVFPGKHTARISERALREGFNAACAAGGVQRPTEIKACNAWHMLRHSFATEMEPHVDPLVLSMILGHGRGRGDLRTTQRYIHASRERLRSAMVHADTGRRPVASFLPTLTRTQPQTQPPTDATIEIVPRLAA